LGATAVMIGRPYVFALATGGAAGVTRCILAIASGLSEHEGELSPEQRKAVASKIIELTQQALREIDVTSEELALALQRYNERDKLFWVCSGGSDGRRRSV
jgi:hypothetical protein